MNWPPKSSKPPIEVTYRCETCGAENLMEGRVQDAVLNDNIADLQIHVTKMIGCVHATFEVFLQAMIASHSQNGELPRGKE